MSAATPAGWYPDPHGQAELRYWDGNDWTEHTHNSQAGAQPAPAAPAQPNVQPAAQQAAPPYQAQPQYGPGGGYGSARAKRGGGGRNPMPIVIGAIVALLVIGGIVFAITQLAGEKDEDKVTDATKAALTDKSEGVCESAVTSDFVEQSTGQRGDAAATACKDARRKAPFANTADVSDVELDGSSATAVAAVTGGNFSGKRVNVELDKDGDDWKVDGLSADGEAVTILGGPDPTQAKSDVEDAVTGFGSSVGSNGCDFLSPKKLSELGGRSGCDSAYKDFTATTYTIEETKITGTKATCLVTTESNNKLEFTLSYIDGEWKIDDFEGQ